MAKINTHYRKLLAGYLFPEINRKVNAYMTQNPDKKVHRLGIGNTTEPLTPTVIEGLRDEVERLSRVETYTGYGDEQGSEELRLELARFYGLRGIELDPDEIFVSDGAKPDVGNIQSLFAPESSVAVQDPAYPVYVDTNVIAGRTAGFDQDRRHYSGLFYMVCNQNNNFIPEPPAVPVDMIYICNPNNPTGAVAAARDLKKFVDYALEHRSLLIYDGAYSAFITDPSLPLSIYEIDGAKECAVEVNSFSKMAGFTGVRLGWAVVPKTLVVENSEPGELNRMWLRRQTTFFNGASIISQRGGLAALSDEGLRECKELCGYYMENAGIIGEGLDLLGLSYTGGVNAPYLWLKTPGNMTSWEFFDKLLREAQVVGTPGSGFGPSGEGYFRLSAFGHRQDIESAVESMVKGLEI